MASQFYSDRMPLSPMKPAQATNVIASPMTPDAKIYEVPCLSGYAQDKENAQSTNGAKSNTKLYEDSVTDKPTLINLDSGNVQHNFDMIPTPLRQRSTLGRPPKIQEQQATNAPKVRLCSDMARGGMVPACVMTFVLAVIAASYSSEDHSFSNLYRAIGSASEDVSECWLSSLVVISIALISVMGLVCTWYMYLGVDEPAGSKSARPKNRTERAGAMEDSWRRQRTRGY